MRSLHRAATVAAATVSVLAIGAGSAMAHQCVNPNKQPGAGAKVLVDVATGEITLLTKGLQKRYPDGLGENDVVRGLWGIDFDSDGKADVTTYIVGKGGEIPHRAQVAGAECNGIINFEAYMGCMQAELAG